MIQVIMGNFINTLLLWKGVLLCSKRIRKFFIFYIDIFIYSCYHLFKVVSYLEYNNKRVGDIIKQIIVRLDDKKHQELKIKVIKDGVSVQSLIEDIVDVYLNNNISANELLEKIGK